MDNFDNHCLIIGCGKMGLLHGSLINRVPGLKVSGLVDPSFQSRSVAKGIGISAPVYSTIDKAMKGKSPGLAIICTPPNTHFSIVSKFLDRGWGVFVEKPLAMNSDKSKELVEIASKRELYNQVGFQLRFNPAIRFLYEYINDNFDDKGESIDSVEIEILSPQFSGVRDSSLGKIRGGVKWDLLPHVIDLGIYLMGVKNNQGISISKSERNAWKSVFAEIDLNGTSFKATADWSCESVRKVETRGKININGSTSISFDMDKVWFENGEVLFHRRSHDNPFFEVADQEYSFQIEHLSENSINSTKGPASDFESSWLVDWIIENIEGAKV